jgi:hypothetical protein
MSKKKTQTQKLLGYKKQNSLKNQAKGQRKFALIGIADFAFF